MNVKAIPELSVDAQTLAKLLEALAPGETIPYSTLNEAIGRDVQNEAYGVLQTAKRIVLREKAIVVEAVIGIGVKRLSDAEIPSVGSHAIRRIGKTAKVASAKVLCADYDKLDNKGKISVNTSLSVLGALRLMTKGRSVKKIQDAVEQAPNRLASSDVIGLFTK